MQTPINTTHQTQTPVLASPHTACNKREKSTSSSATVSKSSRVRTHKPAIS